MQYAAYAMSNANNAISGICDAISGIYDAISGICDAISCEWKSQDHILYTRLFLSKYPTWNLPNFGLSLKLLNKKKK